jgi:tetratricopeptide (TPR) repeat protein
LISYSSLIRVLENYRRTNLDCAAALEINPSNVKAWYRSARACLALDKLEAAADSAARGLAIDPSNLALRTVSDKIMDRKAHLSELEKARKQREQEAKASEAALSKAFRV